VLLRLVDDYLLVTTNYSKARAFLEMMMKGSSFPAWPIVDVTFMPHLTGNPEYGCFISHEKTRTNFDFGSDPSTVTEPDQKGQGRFVSP